MELEVSLLEPRQSVCSIEQLKPGDMVFYLGNYVNPKTKPQKHDCVHVEVYIGDGRTLGARWGKGVVQEHDSYTFTAKTYTRCVAAWVRPHKH